MPHAHAARNHLNSIVQALDVNEPRDKTDLYDVLRASGRERIRAAA